MGLDITAYSRAVLTEPHEYADECYDRGHRTAVTYAIFERSFRGLAGANQSVATWDGSAMIGGLCYDVSGAEEIDFQAGSYSGYNRWRDRLARTFLGVEAHAVFKDPNAYADRPFFELINFADNEGAIGPEACADLLADFEAGRTRWSVECSADVDGYDLARYDKWTEAFRLATPDGLVRFH